MSRNLVPKFILILVLVVMAVLALYPPNKTLKPGIDLAGGTSLIYAIDTQGLTAAEERDLAQRMITVLRRRIDPKGVQNLVWRPQGNTRFEIQMPLASKETRDKREEYQTTLNGLLAKNVNPATIMRALQLPDPAQRSQTLAQFAQGDPNRLEILNKLASTYDERKGLQNQRDTLTATLDELREKLAAAKIDMSRVEANRSDWAKRDDAALQKELTDFLGAPDQLALLTSYVQTYRSLATALNTLTAPGGVNERYEQARRGLDRLNLTQEQLSLVLDKPVKSLERARQIEALQTKFPDRVNDIDRLVTTYDAYRPYRGRLDDPMDLQRMLRGAGILEFRILPTEGRPELSPAEITRYREDLVEKGPKVASDDRYVWVEVEESEGGWNVRGSITGQFGDKLYVLASNRTPDEVMLHRGGAREWKLEGSHPATDEMGRRAIGFNLDIKGGNLFYNVTSKNGGRPLAIILDDVAISAPEINPDHPIRQSGIITGSFTQTQVTDMVDKLNAGSLPARLIPQPIAERVIGPSIGADNLHRGIRSGIIGLAVVIGFMVAYYLVVGSIADVALLLNLLFTLAIMAELRATFTLPGIAGFILTIGMSVDANVLIFERIREEQERGLGLATAIRNGYQRAFSAIFDSNLTTILTAAILYYVASEDVKGFAIVLMLGIASSMFTAIFVTRVILDLLVSKRLIKDRLLMIQLIRTPNINWMGLRPVFYTISAVLVVGGMTAFLLRGPSKYDIEFTGGTSVQIDLIPDTQLTRQDVEDRITKIGAELGNADLQSASIYSVGNPVGVGPKGEKVFDQYEITTTATNKLETTVTPAAGGPWTTDNVTAAIRKAETEQHRDLGSFAVTARGDKSFAITTSRANRPLVQGILEAAFPNAEISEPVVDEVVSNAIRRAFQGQLQLQQNLRPRIVSTERITDQVLDTYPELADYVGGIKMDVGLEVPATLRQIDQRLRELKFRPDTQDLTSYPYQVFAADLKQVEPNQPLTAFTFASVNPEAGLRELTDEEWTRFVDDEKTRVQQATERETSLQRVTQIDPLVGSEAKTRALISIVLALAAIVAYIWLRFGDLRFGLAAIAALFHDLSAGLGAVAISVFLAGTLIGQALLIGDFRINGAIIAAILTLLGYSLNDTIVVFDRIRENRHRAQLTAQSITNSINQTLSRTIITGFTTFIVVLVMYIFGGSGLRGFNYVIAVGLIVGTYSSIAIAAPLLLIGKRLEQEANVKTGPAAAKARGAGGNLEYKRA
jgi:SecD/SecF fusion protein